MPEKLILVDFESVQTFDISCLDETYRGVIFVGANQAPPKAARKPSTAHRFARVDFMRIEGTGKNALDFHIAFHLGRIFETSPSTACVVLAKDKGYDPLLRHLNMSGMNCRRVESLNDLLAAAVTVPVPVPVPVPERQSETAISTATTLAETTPVIAKAHSEPTVLDPEKTVCRRCKKASTIEHYGGRWCSNCGTFASAPDPKLLPSSQLEHQTRGRNHRADPIGRLVERERRAANMPECGWCHQRTEMSAGIYDDGEWMCGGCVSRHAS